MTNAEVRTASFKDVKAEVLQYAVYQRGPSDTSGYERDREWRREARSARGWEALADALPLNHKLRSAIELRVGW